MLKGKFTSRPYVSLQGEQQSTNIEQEDSASKCVLQERKCHNCPKIIYTDDYDKKVNVRCPECNAKHDEKNAVSIRISQNQCNVQQRQNTLSKNEEATMPALEFVGSTSPFMRSTDVAVISTEFVPQESAFATEHTELQKCFLCPNKVFAVNGKKPIKRCVNCAKKDRDYHRKRLANNKVLISSKLNEEFAYGFFKGKQLYEKLLNRRKRVYDMESVELYIFMIRCMTKTQMKYHHDNLMENCSWYPKALECIKKKFSHKRLFIETKSIVRLDYDIDSQINQFIMPVCKKQKLFFNDSPLLCLHSISST